METVPWTECVCVCVCNAPFSNEFTQSLMRKTEGCRRSFSFCFSSPSLSEGTGEVGNRVRKFTSKCNPVTVGGLSRPENTPAAGGEIKKRKKRDKEG